MKLTTIFFTILCCGIFAAQLFAYIKHTINSDKLYTEMRKVTLSDQPLPFTISICVKPGLNRTEVTDAGYGNEMFFSLGMSDFNRTLIGWGGHTKEGKQLYSSVSDLVWKMSTWKQLSEVVKSIWIVREESIEMKSDQDQINSAVESARIFLSEFCFTLRQNFFLGAETLVVYLQTNLTFQEIEIKLNDISLYSGRRILAHSMNHKGDRMFIKSSEQNLVKTYYVDISQEVYAEEDSTKNCVNYPTNEFETYHNCDSKTALTKLATEISPDFYPLWAATSTNFSSVTLVPVSIEKTSAFMKHTHFVNGIKATNCKLPCTVTQIRAKSFMDQNYHGSGFSVSFNQEMQVTKTSLVQFDPIKCLCDIGGMLGLWLGLGALQLGELLVKTGQMVGRKVALSRMSDGMENT